MSNLRKWTGRPMSTTAKPGPHCSTWLTKVGRHEGSGGAKDGSADGLEQRSSRRNDEPSAARDGEADPAQVVVPTGGSMRALAAVRSEPHAKESAKTAPRGDRGWDVGDAWRAGERTRGRFVSMAQAISGLSLRRCCANPIRANRDTVDMWRRWCGSVTLAPEFGNPTWTVRAIERTLSGLDRDRRSARTTCRG